LLKGGTSHKSSGLNTFHKKALAYLVICFLEVKLHNHLSLFLTLGFMQNFMKGKDTIHYVSPFQEGSLYFMNYHVHHRLHSKGKAFGEPLIKAIQ
jgi:hypothetical protein